MIGHTTNRQTEITTLSKVSIEIYIVLTEQDNE